MTRLVIDTTSGAGDTAKDGGDKINSNFAQLFATTVQAPISGRWFVAMQGGTTVSAGQNSNASMWVYPFVINEAVTITDLGMRVTTANAATTGMLGIYAHSLVTGEPTGTPVASVTGLDMSVTGTPSATLAAPVVLQPGIYWAAFQCSGATAVATFIASSELGFICTASGATSIAALTFAPATVAIAKSVVNTFGTFPDLTGSSPTTSTTRGGALLFYKAQ